RHRVWLALLVSLLATIAMAVPLGYQAYDARNGTSSGPDTSAASTTSASTSATSPTTSATTPTTAAPPSTIGSVPTRVLPEQLERSHGEITWTGHQGAPAAPLDGATVRGKVVVQFTPLASQPQQPQAPTVTRTEFWVDPLTELPPGQIDTEAPFTLSNDVTVGMATVPHTATSGTDPTFDTTLLSNGVHNVTVEATQSDGTKISRYCEFRVANG
ncbi:MAG TPA: hypothetical protein PLS63_00205, partial [Microthrixaceae bacterium]|nr:hypothetical protein [Microthrixaceae bacterium]